MSSSADFGDAFPPTCMALMFKLGAKMTQQEFLQHFEKLYGYGSSNRPYDFVHLPWSSLAIVNFLTVQACAECWARTKTLIALEVSHLKGVRPAANHGLENNLRDYLIRAKGPHARLPPLIFHRGTRIAIAQACRLLGLDLVHTKPGHCNFPAQIHLDVASMSQSPAWDYLGQMTGTRILIDL